ncbi:SlyX family protein [Aurantimonas sp. MSK8Z-1]|uniref:SlyX family protein n=1 Tax=Mangrovibrevibacter kandeliae TaxID=2968473 RepID=UPI002118D6BF|nr:SlyX family protein [Aurantimonas sp. MSK8Z-1]MCW4115950.1 SlyX family protein [Aurantimonas sp. MSK8Z-1]
MTDSDRITELEIALAHQTRIAEELSEEVRRQGRVVDRMERALRELGERFLTLEEVAMPRPEITKPPHY